MAAALEMWAAILLIRFESRISTIRALFGLKHLQGKEKLFINK